MIINSVKISVACIILLSNLPWHEVYSQIQEKNQNDPTLSLENCHLKGIREFVKCGTLEVPENYTQPQGKKLSINVAVLPAIDNSENKTPFMFLAGGPGQAAVELAETIDRNFSEIRKTRDIILIDQRGTGKSHPLVCPEKFEANRNVYEDLPEDLGVQDVKDCLAEMSVGLDLTQFNSENAIRDFDAVRVALGHEKINLYGGSYGTRAGLVYMRLFPKSIRSAILAAVGPIEWPIGLFGKSVANSYASIIRHCEENTHCNKTYPNLKNEFTELIERLKKAPISVSIPHPQLGTDTTFKLSRDKFISLLRLQLYAVSTRSLVPIMIHQAYLGNFKPLAGFQAMAENNTQEMYMGLTYNIICNEDFPKISKTMFDKDADNEFGENASHDPFKLFCPAWTQYRPSDEFYESVATDIPTLIFSGALDPVTPPSNGELTANTLPNSHHIVVDNLSHDVTMGVCMESISNEFLTTLEPKNLDESCIEEIPTETFMTGLNGGQPQ